MTDTQIRVGEIYAADELPDNDTNNSGKPEWVGDNLIAVAHDGALYEFAMAFECTAVYNVTDDGDMELIEGEKR